MLVSNLNINIGLQLIEKIVRLLTSFVITYTLLSTLDEKLYGMMSTFLVINAMFMVLATLGIKDKFILAHVNQSTSKNLVSQLLVTLMFVAFAILLFIQILLILNSSDKVEYFCASLISLQLISNIFIPGRYSAEAKERFKLVSAVDLILNISTLPIKYYCIIFLGNLNLFLIILALEIIIANLVLLFFSRNNLSRDFKKTISISNLLRSSFPILLSSIIIIIYYRVDQVMISILVGYTETAIYAAGSKVTEVLYLIPMTIVAVMFPKMIESYKNASIGILRPLIFYLFWICILASLLISINIEPMWKFLFEDKYQKSINIILIHAWTLPFVALGIVGSRIYVIRGLEKLLFWRSLFILIINIVLNVPAIIFFGAVGAAITTLICQLVAGILFDLISYNTRSIFFLKIKSIFIGFRG